MVEQGSNINSIENRKSLANRIKNLPNSVAVTEYNAEIVGVGLGIFISMFAYNPENNLAARNLLSMGFATTAAVLIADIKRALLHSESTETDVDPTLSSK